MTSANRTRSVLIDAALAVHGTPSAWDVRASVHPCQGAKFHSPSPLITRKYSELGVELDHEIWLCPTCSKNLTCFLHLANIEPMDWPLLREFGNSIRELGLLLLKSRTGNELLDVSEGAERTSVDAIRAQQPNGR